VINLENKKISSERQLYGVLSYVSIISIVLYILKKDDAFVQFHSKQGIVIFFMSLVGMFPILGFPLLILALVLMVIGASKAYAGEEYKIPVIYKIAEKIEF